MRPRHSARLLAASLAVAAACAGVAPAARAQPTAPTVERAAPFDSAGRVLVVTPALAARLRLAPPAFPVQGPFVEARLFAAPDAAAAGAAVLSVTRVGGAVERYTLSAADRAALAAAISAGISAAGPGIRSDTAVTVSEPAGRSFVTNQTLLGLLLYGPAAATLVSADEASTTLAYAAGAGTAFVTSLAVSRRQPVTRAQATLSGSGALGGAAAGAGLLYLLADPGEERAYAGAVLAGSVGGSVFAFRRARGMTDAEASASVTSAFLGAATALSVAGALGAYETGSDATGRATIGSGLAALAAGYAYGPRYARVRRYTVTAGDVSTLSTAATIGAAFGAAAGLAVDDDASQAALAGVSAGLVGGALMGDRLLVRRRDHTQSEPTSSAWGRAWAGCSAARSPPPATPARRRQSPSSASARWAASPSPRASSLPPPTAASAGCAPRSARRPPRGSPSRTGCA
jgi:hypothetical protein